MSPTPLDRPQTTYWWCPEDDTFFTADADVGDVVGCTKLSREEWLEKTREKLG
jgi:hypothetical protein